MTTQTITLRVDAAEHRELAGRAERDGVSLSDYIRVRLGLRGEGPQPDGGDAAAAGHERSRAGSPTTTGGSRRSKPAAPRTRRA